MHYKFDIEAYSKHIQLVGSLSRLFSVSETPFIQYRTVEILFSMVAGGENIASEDNSFDAITKEGIPVGVKTFVASRTAQYKKEKVAEFKQEYTELLRNLDYENAIKEIAQWRNLRVLSDARQKNLDVNKAIYHCLIRRPGEVFIHEEPYPLIDENNITPVSNTGAPVDKFTGLHFSDGVNIYTFSKSKSTLFKKFDFSSGFNSKPISIEILENPIEALQGLLKKNNQELWIPDEKIIEPSVLIAGKDYVVLPLYSSTKKHGKVVYPKSGINQWNAGGRMRNFGEAYIPISSVIHKNEKTSGFFPSRETKFKLKLPNATVLSAKICQAGGKALMSDPNAALGNYLFSVIDAAGSHEKSLDVFTYKDLMKIGKDSVRILKNGNLDYSLEFSSIGSNEDFLDEIAN
jgi:hypothetical protein